MRTELDIWIEQVLRPIDPKDDGLDEEEIEEEENDGE